MVSKGWLASRRAALGGTNPPQFSLSQGYLFAAALLVAHLTEFMTFALWRCAAGTSRRRPRTYHSRNARHLITLDCSNASNTPRRPPIRQQLLPHPSAGSIFPLWNALYVEGSPLPLGGGQADLLSGDVLGPALFSLATLDRFCTRREKRRSRSAGSRGGPHEAHVQGADATRLVSGHIRRADPEAGAEAGATSDMMCDGRKGRG